MGEDAAGDLPDPGDDEAMLSGTPALEALFAALEHAAPLVDPTLLGLLTGSSLAAFG